MISVRYCNRKVVFKIKVDILENKINYLKYGKANTLNLYHYIKAYNLSLYKV